MEFSFWLRIILEEYNFARIRVEFEFLNLGELECKKKKHKSISDTYFPLSNIFVFKKTEWVT